MELKGALSPLMRTKSMAVRAIYLICQYLTHIRFKVRAIQSPRFRVTEVVLNKNNTWRLSTTARNYRTLHANKPLSKTDRNLHYSTIHFDDNNRVIAVSKAEHSCKWRIMTSDSYWLYNTPSKIISLES